MDEKNNDDLLLPGFRFHPTDEELVEFYLKRKLHKQPLPFELIKQVDIYKYDPWDLPKLASAGEKEWYFFCPRDRKYKNSTRPNRVTGSGFWKATGTDRPIYLSGGIKRIGFKKSLVFYRGKAAKSMKTDWMMHEFRLASTSDGAKKSLDKNFHISDSMALCRIFRKSVSMAHRHLSYPNYDTQLNPGSFSSATEKQDNVSALDLSSYKTITDTSGKPSAFKSSDRGNFPGNYHFFDFGGVSGTTDKITTDASNMILNLSPDSKTFEFIDFEGPQQLCNGFPANSLQEIVNIENEEEGMDKDSWGILWDSSPCP